MRRGRWAAVLLAAVIFALAIPAPAFAEKTIGLSSGTFEFTVEPGQNGTGEVIVSNDGDEPLKALVYVSDLQVSETGEQTFTTPDRQNATSQATPATWFRIYMPADSKAVGNTPYLELEPGEKIPIAFEFAPPGGTAPGDHNVIIFFEMFEFAGDTEGTGAQVSGRLGTRVALRVNGQVVEKLTIRPFEVPGFVIGREVPFSFVIKNGGNLNKRVEVTAAVLSRSQTAVAQSVVATDTAIFPSSGREFTGSLVTGGSGLGPHTVEVRVQYMQDGAQLPSELVETRSVWLIPLWLVVLAGFIVVYALGYVIYRALSGRKTKGDPKPPNSGRS
ncbi:MAG: COG1361 family protein [Coriobacteriia bacterium]